MATPQALLARLDALGAVLAADPHGRALIGLGSVGAETARLDTFSDLDFFAVVEAGHKAAFIADLWWCAAAHPIAYAFQNTVDGYKLLFADGIFAEFAVFTPEELARIPFAAPRLIWHHPTFDPALAQPAPTTTPATQPIEWLLGEALSNLLIGLGRARRGEELAALRFIQVYALDRLIEIAERIGGSGAFRDPFNPERRLEQRLPDFAAHLPHLAPGYGQSAAAALALLAQVEALVPVDPAMAAQIRALAEEP